MKKIALSLALLYTVTGCGNPTESLPVTATKEGRSTDVPKAHSIDVTYNQTINSIPLQKVKNPEKEKVIENKKIDNAEIAIYQSRTIDNQIFASLIKGSTAYGIGEIGYGDMRDFPIEEVHVLGKTYIKIIGATGANSPVTYYVLLDSPPPSTLCIDAHTVEADVDEDGIKEIVATVGTAATTTIYKLQENKIVASNLNELMKAQMVTYNPETNTFQVQKTNNELTEWKFQNNKLQLVQ
ncbi:hypothetical protein [Paenibacillus jiagnxiensis]|uniref:hypothetical protein n=1 Tax=Paenibacillus jiagnxiensis TaxID=3228926 RepID=UPI0033BBAF24